MCPHIPLKFGREERNVENFTWLALSAYSVLCVCGIFELGEEKGRGLKAGGRSGHKVSRLP